MTLRPSPRRISPVLWPVWSGEFRIPKKLAPAKAGVADFSDKIMRQGKEISPFPPVRVGETGHRV
jgi:hypothetical protein